MNHYRVILKEAAEKGPPYMVSGDESLLNFDCQADNAEHAKEQTEDFYPGCAIWEVIGPMNDAQYAKLRSLECDTPLQH